MKKENKGVATNTRDRLRSLTVGSPKKFKSELVSFGGEDFEVRQPSISTLRTIAEKAEREGSVGMIDLGLWGMILCTYVPGTNNLVFDEIDYDEIISHPKSKFIELLTAKAIDYIALNPVELEKNSEATDNDT